MSGGHGNGPRGGSGSWGGSGPGGATDGLLVRVDSPVHRLPAEVKLAASLLFVLTVVALPREAVWAPLAAGLALAVAVRLARVGVRVLLPRLVVEVPFLLLAVVLPFTGDGPRVDVAGLALSVEGLRAAWGLVAAVTLAGLTVLLLTATTPMRDLLEGMGRLGLPRLLVVIATAMLRYVDVLLAEVGRMRVARLSRGDDPRWLWQARGIAATAGALFVRAYERGERVHVAMLSRGWTGSPPETGLRAAPTAAQWARGLTLPAAGALVAAAAWAGALG